MCVPLELTTQVLRSPNNSREMLQVCACCTAHRELRLEEMNASVVAMNSDDKDMVCDVRSTPMPFSLQHGQTVHYLVQIPQTNTGDDGRPETLRLEIYFSVVQDERRDSGPLAGTQCTVFRHILTLPSKLVWPRHQQLLYSCARHHQLEPRQCCLWDQ